MKRKFLLVTLILMSVATLGQFKMDGEIRPRLEWRNGYKNMIPNDAESIIIVTQRTRLNFNYGTSLYTTRFSLQEVRTWGEEALNNGAVNIALHEAWIAFNLKSDFTLKIGRQVLKYDNQKLIAATNWNQVGAKHDALKFSYNADGWEFDFVGAINQTGNKLFKSPYLIFDQMYKNLGIIWVKKDWENFSIAKLSIAEGLREDSETTIIHNRFTTGIIASANIKSTSMDGRFFYQGGKKNDGMAVSAYWINLELKQKLSEQNSVMGGIDLMSGNEAPDANAGKDNAFDVLYGGKHAPNGLMDYFAGPKSIRGLGLADLYMKYITKPSENILLSLDYHYFKTQAEFLIDDVTYKSYLGSEIDLSCSIQISSEINLTNIFGIMIPTSSMTIAKNSQPGNTNTGFYFVTMLTFKPVFFKN